MGLALAVLLSFSLPANAQKKLQPLDSARLSSEIDGVLSTLSAVLKAPKAGDPFAPIDGARERLDAVESGLPSLDETERKRLQARLDTARTLLERTALAIGCRAGPQYASSFSPAGGAMAKSMDCLLSDLSDLRGPLPAEVLKSLRERLSRVRASMLQEGLPAAESGAIEERLDLAFAILDAVRRAEAPTPQEKQDAPLAGDLRKMSALPAAELGAVYDNSGVKAPGEEPLQAGPAQAAPAKDDPRPARLQLSLRNGAVPKPERGAEPLPAPKPKDALERLEDSLFAAAGALAGLTDEGKRALFLRTRQDAQERLMTQAGRALLDLGLDPEEFPTLGAADAKLYSLQDKKGQVPSLSSYLARRGLYQIFMQESLEKDAVPQGLRLSPWELGLDTKGVVSVQAHSLAESGSSFRGILTRFEDETTRFEGSDGSSVLIEASLPNDGRVIRTRIDRGRTLTTVLDAAAKKKVHEELVDLAKSLTTHTFFDGAGEVSRIETVNRLTGERELDDRAGRMRMRSKDGRAVVTSSDLSSAWASQEGLLGDDGRFLMQRMIRRDGKVVEAVSPDIVRVSDAGGADASYILNTSPLTGGLKGKARDAHAWDLAGQIVKALGLPDEGKACSRALQTWLRELRPTDGDFTDARITFNAADGFTLAYKLRDGTMRVERASFGTATPYAGQAKGERALVVLQPIHTDRQGNGVQDPRRWAEFLETGAYHYWRSTFGAKPAGWFRSAKTTEEVSLVRQHWSGDAETGKWVTVGSEVKERIENKVPGTSTASILWNGIWDTPVVGHALKGGKWVGQTAVTGVGAGGAEIYYWATGNETAGYYAAHGYANMPAMRAFMDADGYLSRLSPGQRDRVEERAYRYRADGLKDAGYSPERTERPLYLAMYYTPFTKEELMDVLAHARDKRHIDRIIASGLRRRSAGDTGAADGGTLNFLKSASVDALDPILRAALGIPALAQALDSVSGRPEGKNILRDIAWPAALKGAGLTQALLGGTPHAQWIAAGSPGTGEAGSPAGNKPSGPSGQKPSPKPENIASLGKILRESSDPAQAGEARKQLEELKQALLDQAREAAGLPPQSALAKGGLMDLLKKGLDRFFDGNHAPGEEPAPANASLASAGVVRSSRVLGEMTRETPVRRLVAAPATPKGEKETPAEEKPVRLLPAGTTRVLAEAEKTSLDPVFAGGTPSQPGGPKPEGGGPSIPPMGPTRPQPSAMLAKEQSLAAPRPHLVLPEETRAQTPLVPGPAVKTNPKAEAEIQPMFKPEVGRTALKSGLADTVRSWVSDVKGRLLDTPREEPAAGMLAQVTPSAKPLIEAAPSEEPALQTPVARVQPNKGSQVYGPSPLPTPSPTPVIEIEPIEEEPSPQTQVAMTDPVEEPGIQTPVAKPQPKSGLIDKAHSWVSDVKGRLLDAPREEPAAGTLAQVTPSAKPLIEAAPSEEPALQPPVAKAAPKAGTVVDHSLAVARGWALSPASEADVSPNLQPQAANPKHSVQTPLRRQESDTTVPIPHDENAAVNWGIGAKPPPLAPAQTVETYKVYASGPTTTRHPRPVQKTFPAGRKPVVRITRLRQPHEVFILKSGAAALAAAAQRAAEEKPAAPEAGAPRRAEPGRRSAATDRVRAMAAAAASVQSKQPPAAPAISALRGMMDYGMFCGQRLARLMAGHAPSTPILLLLLVLCALAGLGPNAFAIDEEGAVRRSLAV